MRLKIARRTEDRPAAKPESETVSSPSRYVYTVDHTILCHDNGATRKSSNPIQSYPIHLANPPDFYLPTKGTCWKQARTAMGLMAFIGVAGQRSIPVHLSQEQVLEAWGVSVRI